MKSHPSLLLRGLAIFVATAAFASAQALVHDYQFNGNANDSVGSINMTTPNGGSFATPGLFTFGVNQGPRLVAELSLQSAYTVGIRFTFNTVTGFNKVIDFANLGNEVGLYVANGQFNSLTGNGSHVGGTVTAGQSLDLVFSRSNAGVVTGYVNGSQIFSYTDSLGQSVPVNSGGAVFWFFRDDNVNPGEAAAGVVDRIVIYDGVVSAGSVPGLLSAVPEPSTWTVIAGAAVLGFVVLRRRRRGIPTSVNPQTQS